MEVKIKNIYDKKLKKNYHITIPHQMIDDKVNEYINKVRPNFSLKGFRKGQVPNQIIKEKYGESIMAEESDKIISSTIRKIVDENKINLALSPKVDIKEFKFGSDISIEVSFEIYPEVPEIDLGKVKATKREVEIKEGDIEESRKILLKKHCQWKEMDVSHKSKMGDAVNIDYVGRIDKEIFEGGSANGYQLELGSKSFIDDFEDQLVNKKSGDSVKVKVKFPKSYHKIEFASKSAEFEVKVNKVLCAEIPELTNEFLKEKFQIEDRENFEKMLKEETEKKYLKMSRDLFKKELVDFLNKKYDFELPSGMVEKELNKSWEKIEEELKTNPNKFKNDKEKTKLKEEMKEDTEKFIRLGMIFADVAKNQKVEVLQDEVVKEVKKILSGYFPIDNEYGKEILQKYVQDPNLTNSIRSSIMEEKILDLFFNHPSVDKKKVSAKDFDKIWQKANEE